MSILVIPEKPVQVLWQSTIVDIGPGTRYGYKSDVADINSDLCLNNTDATDLVVPMSFLTSDTGENQAPNPSLRIKKEVREDLAEVEMNAQKLEEAVAALAQNQGRSAEQVEQTKSFIRSAINRAARCHRTLVTVKAGQKLYLRTHQRHRIKPNADGIFEFLTVAPLPQFCLQTGGSVHLTVALPRPVDGFGVSMVECTQGFGLQQPIVNERQLVCWKWQNDPELFVKYKY